MMDLHATTNPTLPVSSSSRVPIVHRTWPLWVAFTLAMDTPHSPSSKPRPKYLKPGNLSGNSLDSRIAGSPGISILKK